MNNPYTTPNYFETKLKKDILYLQKCLEAVGYHTTITDQGPYYGSDEITCYIIESSQFMTHEAADVIEAWKKETNLNLNYFLPDKGSLYYEFCTYQFY